MTAELPLEVGSTVKCLWRDGQYHSARILERRSQPEGGSGGGEGAMEYYVHYVEFNRRMDEWVAGDKLDLSTAVRPEKPGAKVAKLDRSRNRGHKRKHEGAAAADGHEELDPHALAEHEECTKVKNVNRIELGKFQVETWYFSPLPPQFNNIDVLYFCEFDLHFFKRKSQLQRHLSKIKKRHPPGNEIYRNNGLSFFEVDGRKEKVYCQNLCYLSKMFLDHKTLYYDVDLFLFYILCENDARGSHIVGYFSKEKRSEEGYNLACILTLPQYQRRGYGKFLIAFSYELSKIEGKVGTPERPLSDLGLVSYRSYWSRAILELLKESRESISIREITDATMIKQDDTISTLQQLDLIKYHKGQHVLCATPELIEHHLKKLGKAGIKVNATKLIWTPYNHNI